jgi:O-succinylbenzoic acid--CoA ligase
MDDRSRNHSLLIRTSGTTGTSRVVELNWENLVESARASRERLGTRSDDLWFAPLPVHHIGGIAPLIRSLYNGTATAFESYSSEKLKRRLTEDPITVVSLVPTMLRDLVEAGLDGGQTQLRTVLVGGAPAEAQLVQSALERELPVHTTYGMTETASQIATARPSELRENPETVGKPLPNVTLEISGTDAGIRGNEKIGEIVVQGPMVAERYCHTDDQEPLNSPRFRTGDLGYLNEQNQLHVVGRKHRGILTGGELVHPVGIETTLNTLDSVEDSHVLGLPDDRLGEKIVSVLVARSEANLDPDSLYEILDKELMDHKIPEELYVVDKLPRTSSGTVDETKIRETLSGLNPYCSNYLGR